MSVYMKKAKSKRATFKDVQLVAKVDRRRYFLLLFLCDS